MWNIYEIHGIYLLCIAIMHGLCQPVIFSKCQLLADSFDLKEKCLLIFIAVLQCSRMQIFAKLSQSVQFAKAYVVLA